MVCRYWINIFEWVRVTVPFQDMWSLWVSDVLVLEPAARPGEHESHNVPRHVSPRALYSLKGSLWRSWLVLLLCMLVSCCLEDASPKGESSLSALALPGFQWHEQWQGKSVKLGMKWLRFPHAVWQKLRQHHVGRSTQVSFPRGAGAPQTLRWSWTPCHIRTGDLPGD